MPQSYPLHILPLTSARFFAAMVVVFYHFEGELPGKSMGWGFTWFQFGGLPVDFFFILSGFVLSSVYLDGVASGRYAHRDFVVKRFARIYPLHLATLLFFVALAATASIVGIELGRPERYNANYLPAHLLMVNAWGWEDHGTFNYPSWSVSAEWFAYLTFPLCGAVILKITATGRATLAIASTAVFVALACVLSLMAIGIPLTGLHSNYAILRVVPEFMLGIALFTFGRDRSFALLQNWVFQAAILALAVFAFYADKTSIASILLLSVLVLALADSGRSERRLLSSPLLVYGGRISYAIYMVHVPVMAVTYNAAERILHIGPSLPVMGLGIVLVLVAAAIAHHLIELPAEKAIKRALLRSAKTAT